MNSENELIPLEYVEYCNVLKLVYTKLNNLITDNYKLLKKHLKRPKAEVIFCNVDNFTTQYLYQLCFMH